jgi:hypothetical protein
MESGVSPLKRVPHAPFNPSVMQYSNRTMLCQTQILIRLRRINHRNTQYSPAAKIMVFLDLEQTGNPPRRDGTERNLIAEENSAFLKGFVV